VNEAVAAADDDVDYERWAGERRGSVDGAHLVLEARLRPHPARSTNYRRGRTVCPPPLLARIRRCCGGGGGGAGGRSTELQKQQHEVAAAACFIYRCGGPPSSLTAGNRTPKPKRNSGYYA